jgi:hypothetical protein
MSRNVTVSFSTSTAVLPAGVEAGGYVVSLLNAADSSVAATQNLALGVFEADFTGVADGDYIATAQALDTTGALLGLVASTPFSVADLTFDQPVAPLTVVIS